MGEGWLVPSLVGVGIVVLWGVLVRATRYRLGRHEFEVLISGLVVRRVFLKDIDDVYVGTHFPCEVWPSRWMLQGRCLTVQRKRGLVRRLTVTPHDPEQLRINLCYALGKKP